MGLEMPPRAGPCREEISEAIAKGLLSIVHWHKSDEPLAGKSRNIGPLFGEDCRSLASFTQSRERTARLHEDPAPREVIGAQVGIGGNEDVAIDHRANAVVASFKDAVGVGQPRARATRQKKSGKEQSKTREKAHEEYNETTRVIYSSPCASFFLIAAEQVKISKNPRGQR